MDRRAMGGVLVLCLLVSACGGSESEGAPPSDAAPAVAAAPAQTASNVIAVPASSEGCPDVDQALVDQGDDLFTGAGICYTCHGQDGAGTQLAPGFLDDEWLNTDGTYGGIAQVVTNGVPEPQQFPSPMPPKGGTNLSADQICAVAAYVYSLSQG